MKILTDNEIKTLNLIRSGTESLMPEGERLLNTHVKTLLRRGYVKYGSGRKAYQLTTLGYHATDVPREDDSDI